MLINYSSNPDLQQFHGKAIAIDIKGRHAPFPSIFIIHEMRVRGFHPFQPISPTIPIDNPWQDWILSGGVLSDSSRSFKRECPPPNRGISTSAASQLQIQTTSTNAGGAPPDTRTLELNADIIAEILAATHAMPSWKACQMDGTSWAGTAEENIQKYVSSIGVEDNDS